MQRWLSIVGIGDGGMAELSGAARACIEKNGVPLTHMIGDGPGMPLPHVLLAT